MLKKLFISLCLYAPSAGLAEDRALAEIAAFEDIDFASLNRSDFIAKHRELINAYWAPGMELYTRAFPSLEELVPEFSWTPEDIAAHRCVYDTLLADEALSAANDMRDVMQATVEYIYENPDFSLANLEEHDAYFELLASEETYSDVARVCKLNEVAMRKLQDSGLVQAYLGLSAN